MLTASYIFIYTEREREGDCGESRESSFVWVRSFRNAHAHTSASICMRDIEYIYTSEHLFGVRIFTAICQQLCIV